MIRPRLAAVAAFALLLAPPPGRAPGQALPPAVVAARPWDVAALKTTPPATWGEPSGDVREVYYEGAGLGGRPTRVFAYYARPSSGDGPFPAILLVHGGGGRAFQEWAKLWADRGYVALAMDTAGRGPDGNRLPDGGPDQDDDSKFRDFAEGDAGSMWTYHAVAAVIRGHSLLADRPEVDSTRVGVTGISWGGYLTCLVAGLDDRLRVAVPVYGCGFLDRDSVWLPRFEAMTPERRRRWVANFDPAGYLPAVRCPILFVNGTNDFAYPLDSYRRSYRAIPGFETSGSPDRLCVTLRMPHGHPQGWAPKEIGLFVDSALKGGKPLARLGPTTIVGRTARAEVAAEVALEKAELLSTDDPGPWKDRRWSATPARIAGKFVEGDLPEIRPLVVYLNVTDARGAVTSSPHASIPEAD